MMVTVGTGPPAAHTSGGLTTNAHTAPQSELNSDMLIGAADGDVERRLLWVACMWFASAEAASMAYQLAHHGQWGMARVVGATDGSG